MFRFTIFFPNGMFTVEYETPAAALRACQLAEDTHRTYLLEEIKELVTI